MGSKTLLEGWARRWRWQRRLEAYLVHEAEQEARVHKQLIRSTKERHISIAKLLQNRALERLQTLDVSRLSPDLVVKFLDLAVHIERQSLDLEVKQPQQNTNVSITEFSLSETRELQSDLQDKLQALSPVSRDIMRQLTVKTLRLLKFQSENLGQDLGMGDQALTLDHGDHGPITDAAAGSEEAADDRGADGSNPPAE